MKRYSIISAFALFFAFTNVFSQDLDKVLKDHFAASGQEKRVKIKSQVITGKSIITTMDMEMPFVITISRPSNIRVESTFQDTKMIQTFNGEKGWMLAPMMGRNEPTELSGDELKLLRGQGDMDSPLWNYESKGNSVELLGEELVKDSPAYKIQIITSEGDVINQFIDKKSNLLIKTTNVNTIGGAETEMENLFSNYKAVKGIQVAHTITTRMNGQTVTSVMIEKVEFNKSIDPKIFGKPSL